MRRSTQGNKLLGRALALLLALCLVSASAFAEGYEDTWTDETWTDGAQWGEVYAPPSINTDADLRLGYVASNLSEVNPFICNERDLLSLNQLVFESLIGLDENLKPVPLLADSWSVEGKTWRFKLRDGVVFHNGMPLTAQEVVTSFNRFMMTGESNPYYARVKLIDSMSAEDERTLIVNSKYMGYITLYALTFPVVQVSTTEDRMARGTGPYWYTEYVTGVGVRLEANPLWWKNDPKVHSIAAINYPDSGAALEALTTGEINILCTQSSHAAVNRKIAELTSMDFSTTSYEMLVPNLGDSSPMGDVRMRQAVMYAMDRANIAENAYLGMGVQCEVPVNPSSWLYETQSARYYYSPERALQLLFDCQWKDLTGDGKLNKLDGVLLKDLTIRLITYNEKTNSIRQNAALTIAGYLEQVGMNVEVTVYSRARCLQKVKDKEYDLALIGAQLSEVPNLAPMLQYGGALNLNNFKNDSMEALLQQVAYAQSEEELKGLYSQIQMLVVERLPVLGLLFRTGTVLSRRSLGGLYGLRSSSMLNGVEFMEK